MRMAFLSRAIKEGEDDCVLFLFQKGDKSSKAEDNGKTSLTPISRSSKLSLLWKLPETYNE